jgi:hypothetical protein
MSAFELTQVPELVSTGVLGQDVGAGDAKGGREGLDPPVFAGQEVDVRSVLLP